MFTGKLSAHPIDDGLAKIVFSFLHHDTGSVLGELFT